jgi:hypothetical protein
MSDALPNIRQALAKFSSFGIGLLSFHSIAGLLRYARNDGTSASHPSPASIAPVIASVAKQSQFHRT